MGAFNKKNKNRNKKKNKRKNAHEASQNEQLDDKKVGTNDENETEPQDDDDLNTSENTPKKRPHDDDNESEDEDDKPKRKKKKKQPVATDTTDKKGKKSIRQMKREKFQQRQADAQASAKDQLKGQCLNYLSQWKHDKANWKFMKAKQAWLYKNKFSTSLLPETSWPLLLEYFESSQGNIRKMLLDDANKIIKQMDEWTESQTEQNEKPDDEEEEEAENEDSEEANKSEKPDENVYKRARDLIQCLEE